MNSQPKTHGHETYQFGFRIPFLPDFLLDHTLLEKEPHERIAEHCRRWTQFIAGLWREEDITFALVFEWNPQPKSFPGLRADSIEITLLGCAMKGHIADELIDTLACALRAFGFAPIDHLQPELREKYPESVKFNEKGFPDFSPYSKVEVEIQYTGNRSDDFDLANEAAGFDDKPEGYSWHHHENGRTMQLVPTDLHKAVAHTGGCATSGLGYEA